MGKRMNYQSREELKKKHSYITAALWFISLFLYLYFVRHVITKIQWNLFANSHTILLTPSLGVWAFLELMGGSAFITIGLLFLEYKFKRHRIDSTYGKYAYKKITYINLLLLSAIISVFLVFISFISYCRVDKNGLHIREVRTLFLEKEYSWDTIKSVEINYYKNSKGSGYNLQYLLNFVRFSVNIQNSGLTSNRELLDEGKREIHKIIKQRNIPVYKNIKKYNDEINEFLKLIGE